MLPLQGIAIGLLLVVIDINIGRDITPDWAGWLIAMLAARHLARLDRGFAVAEVIAFVGMVYSAATWLFPPRSGSPVDSLVTGVVLTTFFVAVCVGIRSRARQADDDATARLAQNVAVGSIGVMAMATIVVIAFDNGADPTTTPVDGFEAVIALGVLLLALAVLVALFVLLFTRAHHPLMAEPPRKEARHCPVRD
jgi:Kef-type K+ transport system membrane component KefB